MSYRQASEGGGWGGVRDVTSRERGGYEASPIENLLGRRSPQHGGKSGPARRGLIPDLRISKQSTDGAKRLANNANAQRAHARCHVDMLLACAVCLLKTN